MHLLPLTRISTKKEYRSLLYIYTYHRNEKQFTARIYTYTVSFIREVLIDISARKKGMRIYAGISYIHIYIYIYIYIYIMCISYCVHSTSKFSNSFPWYHSRGQEIDWVDIHYTPIMNRYELSVLSVCILWTTRWLYINDFERILYNLIFNLSFLFGQFKKSFVFHWPLEDLSESFDKQFSS